MRQPVEHRVIDFFAGVGDRLAGPVDQLLFRDVVAGHPQDRTLQQSPALEAVESLECHLAGQIAGDPEDHQQI